MERVGALLDARGAHPGRTGWQHLRGLALTHSIGTDRIYDLIDLVGLGDTGGQRVRSYSLGMKQRLGIAAALLGDPEVLVFDEPLNGLDPDGVLWFRDLLRDLAAEGRTVLMSSHMLGEVERTADHVVLIREGRVVLDAPMEQIAGSGHERVIVRTPEAARLHEALGRRSRRDGDTLTVSGMTTTQVGVIAHDLSIVIHALEAEPVRLEDAYLELTQHSAVGSASDD